LSKYLVASSYFPCKDTRLQIDID